MPNRILSAQLNIQNGTLKGDMRFEPGLNIISGENGTLKTQLLYALRNGATLTNANDKELKFQAISPKRNSERRAAEQILQHFKTQNRSWDANMNERLGAQLNMTGFDTYASVGELYYLVYQSHLKDGKRAAVDHMQEVANEFNTEIQKVFLKYALVAEWNNELAAPKIQISKNENTLFPIEALSLGEQEVLSLSLSLYFALDHVDVFLIDEPEVHLNWHLEDRLFNYLDELCVTYGKQMIVVTHSRIIFKPQFLAKCQFLSWNDEKQVTWTKTLTKAQRSKLAGDAIEIVALGNFNKVTIFAEDDAHELILNALADSFGVAIGVSQCGNSPNVKSLYLYQRTVGKFINAYFLIDGDNQGNPFPNDPQFICLPYYCIENIIFDVETLSEISFKTVAQVQAILVEAFQKKRAAIFKKNKFFEGMVDSLSPDLMTFERLSTFDGSIIFELIIKDLGLGSPNDMLTKYFAAAKGSGRINKMVPKLLRDALEVARVPVTGVDVVLTKVVQE